MKKELRRAGFVSLTLGALGCGDPARTDPVTPQELFRNDTTRTDSLHGEGWRKYLDAKELHLAWVPPSDSPWRPFYKPTLVAAVSVVQSAAMPVKSGVGAMDEAIATQFGNAVGLSDAAVFVDLPGEESIVWGAMLRKVGIQPVVTINNWPHQFGLLRLERPLGAMIYYASAAAETRLPPSANPAFLLERSRLGQKGYRSSSVDFDNRYFHAVTDFPSAPTFTSRGINRIIYINPRGIVPGCEEDDLNEYFGDLSRAGLQFTYVQPGSVSYQMAVVTPGPRETIFTKQAIAQYSSSPSYHHHYYHSYPGYSYWHSSYWTRSSGAWGGNGAYSGGGGYSSGSSSGFSS